MFFGFLIKKIDISKALKLEGVKSIITNSDLASLKPTDKNANVNFFDLARNVLAKDRRFEKVGFDDGIDIWGFRTRVCIWAIASS